MNNNRRITLMRPSQVFDSFMDEFFNTPSMMMSGGSIQADVYEDEDNVMVDLKAPGFKKEDIEIDIEGDMLTVSGKITEEKEEEKEKKKYYMKEIREESFSRTLTLPTKVDSENSKAKVENGMIKITLPKLPESKPKKIAISAE